MSTKVIEPTPKDVKRILKAVRKRFANPTHWTKGADARINDYETCSVLSSKATCWCFVGAIRAEILLDLGKQVGQRANALPIKSRPLYQACCDELAKTILRRKSVLDRDAESVVIDYNDADHRQIKQIDGVLDRTILRLP